MTPATTQDWRPDATEELSRALTERILVIDGAMGTAIQRDRDALREIGRAHV